jgi:hypothetical protein
MLFSCLSSFKRAVLTFDYVMVSQQAAFVHESACTSCWFVELGIAESTDLKQEQLLPLLFCLTS